MKPEISISHKLPGLADAVGLWNRLQEGVTRILLVEVGPPFCLRQETMFHSVSGFLCFFHVCFSWYLWAPVVGEEAECDFYSCLQL